MGDPYLAASSASPAASKFGRSLPETPIFRWPANWIKIGGTWYWKRGEHPSAEYWTFVQYAEGNYKGLSIWHVYRLIVNIEGERRLVMRMIALIPDGVNPPADYHT